MNTYPDFKQMLAASEEWVDDISVDRAVGGGVKARAFFPAKKRRFTLRHVLSSSERDTLETFYDVNRVLAVSFTWSGNGTTYTCLFEGAPKIQNLGANLAQVEVQLAEQ